MKFKTLLNFQFVVLAFWFETWILYREVSDRKALKPTVFITMVTSTG